MKINEKKINGKKINEKKINEKKINGINFQVLSLAETCHVTCCCRASKQTVPDTHTVTHTAHVKYGNVHLWVTFQQL